MKPLRFVFAFAAALFAATTLAAANPYTITIERPKEGTQGSFKFKGSIELTGKCWWKGPPTGRAAAGTDTSCEATNMAKSRHDAIYIPSLRDRKIFIHFGESEEYSLGCIAVETAVFEKAFADIVGPDRKRINKPIVTVIIKDLP